MQTLPWSTLTSSDLMSKGFFHDRIIPPLTAEDLGPIISSLEAFAATDKTSRGAPAKKTRCVHHSYPKRRLARRILSVPNPRNQIFLAKEVATHWSDLKNLCNRSPISLTKPVLSISRALQGEFERRAEGVERTTRSVGKRYVLHADIARFYPSIYTHSIPWAIHGKEQRNDRSPALYGNLLDQWMRETQSQQTGGIPVGPDTSYLIAEVLASTIDHALQASLGSLVGTRYIDDYHLYFATHSDAEHALAELHRISSIYELEINDLKTSIETVPESIEPAWKTQLRATHIKGRDHATSLKAVFDLAADLAQKNPQDGVFAYLVKKIEALLKKLILEPKEWVVLDALLLRAAVGEPACMPTVLRIFEQNNRHPASVEDALSTMCLVHSGLQQASEVSWALWAAKKLAVPLSQAVADAVAKVNDDIVALVALDLHQSNLLPLPADNFSLWRSYMSAENLYSEHWLIAYEAFVQGWLPSLENLDHVTHDPYFSILAEAVVRFYDVSDDIEVPEDSGYEQEDEEEIYEDEEDGEEEEDENQEG